MAISYINTANTFQQWLVATQSLITTANNLTDGGNSYIFYANTNLTVGNNLTVGGNTQVSGNLTVTGSITTGTINTANITGYANIASANINGTLYVAGDAIFGGNVTLDSIGFDDLTVTGNSSITLNQTIGGTLGVTGNTTLANATVTNTLTANIVNVTSLVGTANNQIYSLINGSIETSLAFAIALG